MEKIENKTFGYLKVLEDLGKSNKNRNKMYKCKCQCGKIIELPRNSIITGNTKSCGCMHLESSINNFAPRIAKDMKYNTNIAVISSNTPYKCNSSGFRGVTFDKSRNKWAVYLQIHNKRKYLGRYKTFEEAKQVRIEAVEQYFKPLLEQIAKDGE